MQASAKDVLESKSLLWLLNIAAEAMLVADRDSRILLANPAAERLFGYARGEFEALTIEDLIPARFRTAHRLKRADYALGPESRIMGAGPAIYGLRKDGTEFDSDVSLSPMEDGLVLAVVHDISRRNEALIAAREFAESIITTIQEPLVVLDAENRLVSANRAFYRMFRLIPEEVVGEDFFELYDRQWDFKELREMHSNILPRKGLVEGFELRHDFPGIGKRTLRINARKVMGKTGKQKFILLAMEDITERKRLQAEQTRMIHELESANEELKNFAYVVSHDLKAPLRAIGSLADWIAADQKERLDDEGREHLRLLIQRTRRMDALINGVLQYSRLGRVHETFATVDLEKLVREVVDLLAPPAHIKVIVEETLPMIRAERARIQQVFQNLLSNAIRYIDKPHGMITIRCQDDGDRWKFSVADNGPGIEKRHFERIFQLFQTLNPRDRVESTGVGLAIVKKIVEMHGGSVWVESTVGEGSTFFFTLPKTLPEPFQTEKSS